MNSKCLAILNDIKKYKELTINDNIKDRLDRVMKMYIDDIESASEKILMKRRKDLVMKELNK